MKLPKVYLAGPDVFLADPHVLAEEKKTICTRYGFQGCSPLDNELSPEGLSPAEFAMAISQANERMMNSCDLIIANMTPFHGPSMDVGTAYEMGYIRAQGKPVFGYSNSAQSFSDRVADGFASSLSEKPESGMTVEKFGLVDNLMLVGAVAISVETTTALPSHFYTDVTAFEQCVVKAAEFMGEEK